MTEAPKVYAAIHKILAHLQVDKTGTLPGNMGGSKYAPASAVSNEVKKQFVAHNLILQSNEEVNKHENIDIQGGKTRIAVSIKGTYTVIHIEDGSKFTFSGTGDGLATGTAVASNIASTNALKNGLLRTFLISEDSVEAASLKEQETPKQSQAQRAASSSKPAAEKKAPAAPETAGKEDYRATVKAFIEDSGNDYTSEMVNALHTKITKDTGKTKAEALPDLVKALRNGEVA